MHALSFRKLLIILFLCFLLVPSAVFAPDSEESEAEEQVTTTAQAVFDELHANIDSDSCNPPPGSGLIPFATIPVILVAFLFFIVALIMYMLGNFLQSPQVLALAKEEGYMVIFTIALAVFTYAAIAASDMFSLILPIYSAPTMIDVAIKFSFSIGNVLAKDLSVLIFFNGILGFFATSTMYFGSFENSMVIAPGLALKPLTDVITLMIQLVSVSMAEWLFHIVTLCFIKKWIPVVFIPLGLFLRAIPYTRDGGNAILALSISLAIIYPALFFVQGVIFDLTRPNLEYGGMLFQLFNQLGWSNVLIAGAAIYLISQTVLVPILIVGFGDLTFMLAKESLYMFAVMSLFFPFINIFITMTVAKEIGKAIFNAETNFTAIIRVI